MGVISTRNFSIGLPCGKGTVCLSKELKEFLWQTRSFRSDSTLMGCDKKKTPRDFAAECAKRSLPPKEKPCKETSQRQKPRLLTQKCTPPNPPCCRKRPKNTKCSSQQSTPPCPPPCPTPCPEPVKPPPPKICYRKCPSPPKLPRLPKCPKILKPPPPPPLPKIPRPPKCPPPCPPPPPPPLPKCPKVPKCPECPPQKECPPPPPCEPCPCPLPCPPPCCPPPPPCPPCPPPIQCPKPLPCPPPPPPRVCPPCPPCPQCPEPPPCPPPPPCCPCPCPKPPPPCPCPKICPPCKQQAEPPKCPPDVPSCPKNCKNNVKKRKMSTYYAPSRFLSSKTVWFRKFHVSAITMGKDSKCKKMGDICEKTTKGSCVKPCPKERDCGKKKLACEPPKPKKKKMKKGDDCLETCIPRGKCDQPDVPAPPKMVYGKGKCPPPKFAPATPCPDVPKVIEETCVGTRSTTKRKKEICPPPPLPKPPTAPVILCPCPPPPKLHPGPCPCYDIKKEEYVKSLMPPCPVKEKYVCCKESLYCPPEPLICKKEKKCEVKARKKEMRKKPIS